MKIGEYYTRDEIHRMHGGGTQVFAPHKGRKITCLCLDPKRNPDAPRVVLPAGGKLRERMVEMIGMIELPVPTFLKVETKCWEYVGDYLTQRVSRSQRDIDAQHHGSITPKDEIIAVIYLSQATAQNQSVVATPTAAR